MSLIGNLIGKIIGNLLGSIGTPSGEIVYGSINPATFNLSAQPITGFPSSVSGLISSNTISFSVQPITGLPSNSYGEIFSASISFQAQDLVYEVYGSIEPVTISFAPQPITGIPSNIQGSILPSSIYLLAQPIAGAPSGIQGTISSASISFYAQPIVGVPAQSYGSLNPSLIVFSAQPISGIPSNVQGSITQASIVFQAIQITGSPSGTQGTIDSTSISFSAQPITGVPYIAYGQLPFAEINFAAQPITGIPSNIQGFIDTSVIYFTAQEIVGKPGNVLGNILSDIVYFSALDLTGSITQPYRKRDNARQNFALKLEANFYLHGILADPIEFEKIEIWRSGEGLENGGTLAHTINSPNVYHRETGKYSIILDGDWGGEEAISGTRYYDVWHVKMEQRSVKTFGFSFYLHDESFYCQEEHPKIRFDIALSRKHIVRNENLDLRLKLIPLINHSERGDYMIPVNGVRAKIMDFRNLDVSDWMELVFTSKEAVFPTDCFSDREPGQYSIVSELYLGNGQTIRSSKMPIMLVE